MTAPDEQLVRYDYALVRVIPDVRTGDFTTIGVVLQARRADFLDCAFPGELQPTSGLETDLLERYIQAFQRVVRGGVDAGPIGVHPPSERFHWLTAVRSTVLTTSPVHTGSAEDPAEALRQICDAIGR